MAKEIVLPVQARPDSTVQSMRRQGLIPAVVYGEKDPSLSIAVDKKTFLTALHNEMGAHALFSLTMDTKEPQLVIVKERQRDMLSQEIIHIDFQRISLNKKIEVDIAIKLVGEAPGVKEGGLIEMPMHTIRISCFPQDIPHDIPVDVSSLAIGFSLHVKDIVFSEGLTVLADTESVVVHVAEPPKEEEKPVAAAGEAAAAGTTAAEPEVIAAKGKKEEEEGAAKEGGKEAAKPEKK